jgi:hypothetical protein
VIWNLTQAQRLSWAARLSKLRAYEAVLANNRQYRNLIGAFFSSLAFIYPAKDIACSEVAASSMQALHQKRDVFRFLASHARRRRPPQVTHQLANELGIRP